MKLTDESWIGYLKNKGNEEFQKYMEDLTDMQDHVLPYQQSFCSLEEKGVQERREQQVQKNRTVLLEQSEAKKATATAKKPSIHERLEINKRKIQEKQGKDKPERGADLGVRTV